MSRAAAKLAACSLAGLAVLSAAFFLMLAASKVSSGDLFLYGLMAVLAAGTIALTVESRRLWQTG